MLYKWVTRRSVIFSKGMATWESWTLAPHAGTDGNTLIADIQMQLEALCVLGFSLGSVEVGAGPVSVVSAPESRLFAVFPACVF